jgi:hypothetical protein
MVVAVRVLRLRIRLWHHALHRGQVLAGGSRDGQAARRSHVEAVAHDGDVGIGVVVGVHLAAPHVLAGNEARLVLEGDAVVVALGDEVGLFLARRVEEVELLAPVALALRLGAVVARRLGLVALEMALSARQTSCARALGLAVGRGLAVSLLGRSRAAARRWVARRGGHGARHGRQWHREGARDSGRSQLGVLVSQSKEAEDEDEDEDEDEEESAVAVGQRGRDGASR